MAVEKGSTQTHICQKEPKDDGAKTGKGETVSSSSQLSQLVCPQGLRILQQHTSHSYI